MAVTTLAIDDQGKPTRESKRLATSNVVFEVHSFFTSIPYPIESTVFDIPLWLVLALTQDTTGTRLGIIGPRKDGPVCGWPVFLSKSILAEWVKSHPQVSCSRAISAHGEACYRLDIANPSRACPEAKLFVRVSDLSPVELHHVYADDTHGVTELVFENANGKSSWCQNAKAQWFNGNQVYRETSYAFVREKDPEPPLTANADAFFVPGTQVLDQRFSKPLSYEVGQRLPNAAEIKHMLESSDGVKSYELAPRQQAEGPKPRLYLLKSQGRILAVLRVAPGTECEVKSLNGSGQIMYDQTAGTVVASNGVCLKVISGTDSITSVADEIEGVPIAILNTLGHERNGFFRLKSHKLVLAEIRGIEANRIQMCNYRMQGGDGRRTTLRASKESMPMTAQFILEGGPSVEVTAEEMELGRDLKTGPTQSPPAK